MLIRRLPGKSQFTLYVIIRPESEPFEVGEVVLELSSGERLPIELEGRFFRVLRILIEVALCDLNLDLEVRGLRSRSVIARHYAAQANVKAAPADDVMKSYVMKIRAAFKNVIEELVAMANIFPPPLYPQIIVTTRGIGYSIGDLNIVFIDHTAKN